MYRDPPVGDEAVLIVDDEALLRMVLLDAFEESGYRVLEAADAAEALAVLSCEPAVRIVVTDIQMPGSMNGIKLAAYIRAAFPPIALIVTSGALRPRSEELPEGTIFLQKPIDTAALLARIDALVAAQR